MTLRKKTLIRIGITVVGLIAVLFITSRTILLRGFAQLEKQDAHQNIERVTSALSDDLGKLSTTVADWAYWDDTVEFVEGSYDSYVEDNLTDSTFINLRLNLMLFTNSAGQIFFAKALDLESETEIPIQGLQEHIQLDTPLMHHPDTESSVTGIILLPEGPMLVASRPILTSAQEGPAHGVLVMGRYLDSAEVQRLAETTHLSLTMHPLDDSQMDPDFQTALSSLSVETPTFIQPLDSDTIAGYALQNDVYGQSALVLRVDLPRDIYRQGRTSISYFGLSLLTVGLVFGLVTLLILEGQVLSRLTRISQAVSDIGESGDLSARVMMTGEDELSNLATAINGMLKSLQESDARLAEHNRDLARRARYLEATAKVAQDAASVLNLSELLMRVVDLISERFGFYYAGIFLLDPTGEWAVLQAASSEAGQRLLARRYHLRVGQEGIVGYVTNRGEPRIALDVDTDSAFFKDPELPYTRSEVALPLRAGGEIIGALDVQSQEPGAFSEEDAAVLQTFADQVAMAISNARLFQQLQESLRGQRQAFGELSRQAWVETLHTHPGLGYRYAQGNVFPLNKRLSPLDEQQVDSDGQHPAPIYPERDKELPELTLSLKVRDHVIGTIQVRKPDGADDWTAEEETLLKTLTDQLGVALESARLYRDAQRRAIHEQLVSTVTGRIRETLDMDIILKTAAQETRQALGLPEVTVRLAARPVDEGEDGAEKRSEGFPDWYGSSDGGNNA
jgi:sensor domain CHASE-containing protein/GAF domain-containing protein